MKSRFAPGVSLDTHFIGLAVDTVHDSVFPWLNQMSAVSKSSKSKVSQGVIEVADSNPSCLRLSQVVV